MTDWMKHIKEYTFADMEGKVLTMHVGYHEGIYYIFGRDETTGNVYVFKEHHNRID